MDMEHMEEAGDKELSHVSSESDLPESARLGAGGTHPTVMFPHDFDLQQSSLALLKAELKLVTHDRDYLRKELNRCQQGPSSLNSSSSQWLNAVGGTLPRKSLTSASSASQPIAPADRSWSTTSVRDYDALQQHCDKAMSELQALKRQHSETVRRCEATVRESEYYRGQNRLVLSKLDMTAQEAMTLRTKYSEVLAGKQRLEQEVHNLTQAREEDRKEMCELRRQQQEHMVKENGTNEALNQLYMNTLRKYEAMKDDYDSLRKRYADLVASHSAAVSKLELAQEEMTRLNKQYEDTMQERNAAVRERNGLRQQCTQAIREWHTALRERNDYQELLAKVRHQHEEAIKEVNQAMAVRIKASKDVKRLTEERNAAMQEYSLIMSERDTVHKEIEKLQDDLAQATKKNKALDTKNSELSEEKKVLTYQIESLRREIISALHDRDVALKELNDMREKYGGENAWPDVRMRTESGEQDRRETLRKIEQLKSSPSHPKSAHTLDSADQTNAEVDQLRKQLEKAQLELQEALQEAEISKRRRDWAFGERDKVVLERESIRTLCDRLRRERDRAVSELAEALRDSDDIKRQKNDLGKELKDLKEKMETQIERNSEKETNANVNPNPAASVRHHQSCDSALGTDMSSDGGYNFSVQPLSAPVSQGSIASDVSMPEHKVSLASSKGSKTLSRREDHNTSADKGHKGLHGVSATSGTGPLDLLRDKIARIRRHSKERHSHDHVDPKRATIAVENNSANAVAPATLTTQQQQRHSVHGGALGVSDANGSHEAAAIAALETVIDAYQTENVSSVVSSVNNNMNSSRSSVKSKKGKNSDKRNGGSNLREESSNGWSSGGTWPRYRAGSPFDFHAGTLFHSYKYPKERLPLSVFIDTSAAKNSSNNVTNNNVSKKSSSRIDETNGSNYDSAAYCLRNSDYTPVYPTFDSIKRISGLENPNASSHHSSSFARVSMRKPVDLEPQQRNEEPKHAPSDASIDFSVKSGNLGKEDLEYYVKKKSSGGSSTSKYSQSDVGSEGNISQVEMHSPQAKTFAPLSLAPPHTPGASSTGKNGTSSTSGPSLFLPPSAALLPAPLSTHLRIQSQLYGSGSPPMTSLRSSGSYNQYKIPIAHFPPVTTTHTHTHPHVMPYVAPAPPRYTSPPPVLSSMGGNRGETPTSAPLDVETGSIMSSSYSIEGPSSYNMNPVSIKGFSHSPSLSMDTTFGRGYVMVPSHSHGGYPSEEIHLPFDLDTGGLAAAKKDPQRIRIPSNQSVTSRSSIGLVSSSSIERLSERGSPMLMNMPNFHVEVLSPGRGEGRTSLTDYAWSKNRSAPGELRRVYIEKSSEPLGFQIDCKNSGGVFVSAVNQASLAAQIGLQVGDQLLEVCGINMRSATYELAANVLRQCGDSVTMLVQYNPSKYQETCLGGGGVGGNGGTGTSSSSSEDAPEHRECTRSRSHSGSPTPCNSPRPPRSALSPLDSSGKDFPDSASSTLRSPLHLNNGNAERSTKDRIERNSDIRSSLIMPPSLHGTLTRHQINQAMASLKRQSSAASQDDSHRGKDPRLVFLEMKKTSNLGISLVGGNAVGIFVHAVQPESPAQQGGLKCGDRILEYNGVNLREATAEQAAYELAKPVEKVALVVQHDLERYREIAEQPGDSFYVKAQFDKLSSETGDPTELCFRRDDILYVDNTMLNGVPGLWRAWLLDSDGQKSHCGVVPSKYKIEEDLLLRRSLSDLDPDGSRRSSTTARRSFFRRRKHPRSSSRDSKELASFSDASLSVSSETVGPSNSLSLAAENSPQRPISYVRVEKYDCVVVRPVLIVGPLADCVMERLIQDYSHKFFRCVPEIMRVPQSYMEKGLEENVFVEYKRRGSHFECITVAAVQDLCEKDGHCLLDVGLNAVERLQVHRIFPIVIFLKYKNVKHVREVKDARLGADKNAAKATKEMYEIGLKIEAEYRHLLSAVIQAGGNLAYICTQVVAAVDQEQRKTLWVPHGNMW